MELSEYDNIARLEETHWWYVGQRRIATDWVRGLALSPGANILDAGCGTGGGLRWLAAMGTPTGIDFHPRAVQYAAQTSPRVARASVEQAPFPTGTFDLVTSFEVLYHLSVGDDVAALRELARVLKPGGWLLVRVPAHDWLRGAHDRLVHTRHRYAPSELRAKIKTARLEVRRLTYTGWLLFPIAVLTRATQRATTTHTDVTLPSPWVNQLLTATFAAESLWLKNFDLPLGLSLLALARKP